MRALLRILTTNHTLLQTEHIHPYPTLIIHLVLRHRERWHCRPISTSRVPDSLLHHHQLQTAYRTVLGAMAQETQVHQLTMTRHQSIAMELQAGIIRYAHESNVSNTEASFFEKFNIRLTASD